MEIIVRAGALADNADWNEAARRDLFFRAEAYHLLYGSNWSCISIRDRGRTFVHVHAPSPIADLGSYDIEPYLGYSGPIVNTEDHGFICDALEAYSSLCRQRRIVAELIRFNPVLGNHCAFQNMTARIGLLAVKPLLYIALHSEESRLYPQYNATSRNEIRAALRSCAVTWIERPTIVEWILFRRLYGATLQRVQASSEWHFDDSFHERLRLSPLTRLVLIRAKGQYLGAAVFLVAGACAYYFLGARSDDALEQHGVMKLLIHCGARESARAGATWLCLGGGRTSAYSDSLFRFKRSLSNVEKLLPLGFLKHDTQELERLYTWATHDEPDNGQVPLFLRYRCVRRFSSGRMRTGNFGAGMSTVE